MTSRKVVVQHETRATKSVTHCFLRVHSFNAPVKPSIDTCSRRGLFPRGEKSSVDPPRGPLSRDVRAARRGYTSRIHVHWLGFFGRLSTKEERMATVQLFDTHGRVSVSTTAVLGDDRSVRVEQTALARPRTERRRSPRYTVSQSRVDCMHAEVARIFVGVERRIKTGKLRTIDTELPHVGSRRPLRVPGHTHAAHTRQRHPTSRAFLHGVLAGSRWFSPVLLFSANISFVSSKFQLYFVDVKVL